MLRRPSWWQHQWHQHRDQSKWTEDWDSHKLQVSGLSYNWWGFQAQDTLQESTDNSSIDRVETNFGMIEVSLSVPRHDWCAPSSHLSSCMHVSHGPPQQSSEEEYKPWKWGATARYYASYIKTMVPMRKSVPNPAGNRTTRRRPDHCKETQTAVVW